MATRTESAGSSRASGSAAQTGNLRPVPTTGVTAVGGGLPSDATDFVSHRFVQAAAIVHHARCALEPERAEERPDPVYVVNILQHALGRMCQAQAKLDEAYDAAGRPEWDAWGTLHGLVVDVVALLAVIETVTWNNGAEFVMNEAITDNYLWSVNDAIEECVEALCAVSEESRHG